MPLKTVTTRFEKLSERMRLSNESDTRKLVSATCVSKPRCGKCWIAVWLVTMLSGLVALQPGSVARASTVKSSASIAPRFLVSEGCSVEPREIEEFVAISGTPGALVSTAMGTAVIDATPPSGGMPADAAVIGKVTDTLTEFVECIAKGDTRRVAALYSDQYFRRLFGGFDQRAIAEIAGTPIPLPEGIGPSHVSVQDVRLLPDGRVTAIADVGGEQSLMIFVDVDGRYLIDDTLELSRPATPEP